jgi:protoporphyrinogen oxidase
MPEDTNSNNNLPEPAPDAPAAKRKELRVQPPAKLARPDMREKPTVILGGGPAGLTAAYLLAKMGLPVIVLEAEDQVGGIAKTAVRDGYRFDLGGHRFFTKAKEVEALWHEIMAEEFLVRPRMSRIYWRDTRGKGKFLDYPLRGPDVMKKLGPIDLTKALLSYLWAAVKPKGKEDTFEEWVSNRFGRWLFNQFFKSYTEKVWGVSTSEIRADWAAQRIKNLSFFTAAYSAFFGNKGNKVTSLIDSFNYPRYGPGQMWETMTEDIRSLGGQVLLEKPVTKLEFEGDRITKVHVGDEVYEPSAVISSLPLRNAVGMAQPHPRGEVITAARGLRYRDFLTVSLVLDGEDLFPDNWIYIHDPNVTVGRIQNFRSWSPWMVPDPTKACVGMEFFCFAGDELWEMDDDDLVQLGIRELEQLGLAKRDALEFGFVTRVPKAYPIYDEEYADRVKTIRSWLDGLDNYIQVGRNGLHRYNNSDHSALTAMRAVDNLVKGTDHDIWEINAESAYHEEEKQDEQQPYIQPPETESMKEPLAG